MALLSERHHADGLSSDSGLILRIITTLLMFLAAALVLVFVTIALGVAPTTDIDQCATDSAVCVAY